ncbi:hypothetical protein BH23GEM9_BH23GEM9_27050 [soil metagenome]
MPLIPVLLLLLAVLACDRGAGAAAAARSSLAEEHVVPDAAEPDPSSATIPDPSSATIPAPSSATIPDMSPATIPDPSSATAQQRGFPREPVPAQLFGMHLIKVWLPGVDWPATPVGLYRLVDATPRWHHLSPAPGRWYDDTQQGAGMSRIHAALLFRDRHGAGTPAMFTLGGGGDDRRNGQWGGGFPAWFTARTDTLAEWRRYVREVGTRFRGRVQLWEVWNEPDCVCFYTGDVRLLVQLTRVAAEELRRIDPANRIVAPAFTDEGLAMMDAFHAAGGGRYVDIVAWHQTNHFPPERDTVRIRAARAIMVKHGIGDKPLWTTEGHAIAHASTSDAAILARTYLTLWLYGVSSFSWYAWDIAEYATVPGHERTQWVTLTDASYRVTSAGVAYRELYRWLVGSRVTSFRIEGDAWIVGTDRGWIVWAAGPRVTPWTVPGGMTRVRRLDGSSATAPQPTFVPAAEPVFFHQ